MLGNIKLDGETILEGVEVQMDRALPLEGPLRQWAGTFTFPDDTPARLVANRIFERGAVRTLLLEDGRSGEFIPKGMVNNQYSIMIEFLGTSPLS